MAPTLIQGNDQHAVIKIEFDETFVKEEIKNEEHFLEDSSSWEFSSINNEVVQNGLKREFPCDTTDNKCLNREKSGDNLINREHIKWENGYGSRCNRENLILPGLKKNFKTPKNSLIKECKILLSKLQVKNFTCEKCSFYWWSNAAKKCHTCKSIKLGDEGSTVRTNEKSNGTKHFQCSQCEKSFSQKGHFNSHTYSVHEKVKNAQCPHCSSKFSYNHELKYHISYVHSGIRTHQCRQCSASFSRKGHLTQHNSNVHEKLKQYQCSKCKSTFCNKFELNRHTSSVHLKLKPFKCEICLANFTRRNSLNKHISSFHQKNRSFSCSKCKKTFNRKDCLKSHIFTVHEEM